MTYRQILRQLFMPLIETIQTNLKKGKTVFPSAEQQEKMINESLNAHCDYRFIVDLEKSAIRPLVENDDKFPFPERTEISLEEFFSHVHEVFLTPFLTYARHSYELAREAKISKQELVKLKFIIDLPITLPADTHHRWYKQRASILSINNNNEISSHINFYDRGSALLSVKGKPQKTLITAAILKEDNSVYAQFEDDMEKKMANYLWNVALAPIHRKTILDHLTNVVPPGKENYAQNKEIYNRLLKYINYRFGSIEDVIDFLESWDVDFGLVPAK
jgi:hypothetical protein